MEKQKVEFTPGPWEVEQSDDGMWITGPDRNANIICDIVERTSVYVEDTKTHVPCLQTEDLANARLISAAPELLESLQHMVFIFNRDDLGDIGKNAILEAQGAISKALNQ